MNTKAAETLHIQSTKQNDPRQHSVPILPKSLSTIHEDVNLTRPKFVACGTCSHCLRGPCQVCPSCHELQKKCPFLVCENNAYSIHHIKKAERMARQAFQVHPQRLSVRFESLFGVDGLLTRQKLERQKEKESLYQNMFGETGDTPHRQIMLRSRFPRTPHKTDDDSIVLTSSGTDNTVARTPSTPQARKKDDDSIVRTSTSSWNNDKFAGFPRTPQARKKDDDSIVLTSSWSDRKVIARFPRTPEARKKDDDSIVRTSTSSWNDRKVARVTPCQVAKDTKMSQDGTSRDSDTCETSNQMIRSLDCRSIGHKRKAEDDAYATQRAKTGRTNRYDDIASPRLKLPPKQIFAEPFNDEVTLMQHKSKDPCRRCRIVTVHGLCFDCNRIQKISTNDILFSHVDMDPAQKARVMQYIQSSLRVSTMNPKGGASSVSTEQTKSKVKFDDSSYQYVEQLWRDRDHPYLFGDRISRHSASFVAGVDASTRRGK